VLNAAMPEQQAEIKVQITGLNIHYKEGSFTPTEQEQPEIDPDLIMISLALTGHKYKYLPDVGGNLLMKAEDAKRLSLMVGDKLTLKLIKDNQ
jgi:hypothetical protein